uniref:Uncharacterized protein n=1 Tax=Rubinisphaera brasiliensis (strain ATCC 49424 / DSM 5305 / JCM 21570 / IAM 15109 / NBRC 103401 / IFAM 1448) TaxID=756272 RepID=F0SNJ9_RUBBR|nr:hypothetical protein Plabr_0203 [Rubinisphaera brasiliensis DSM 5305]
MTRERKPIAWRMEQWENGTRWTFGVFAINRSESGQVTLNYLYSWCPVASVTSAMQAVADRVWKSE